MEKKTLAQRKEILDRAIARYSKQGYLIEKRTDTTAQLRRPKKFSCLAASLWTLLFGIGLIFYLFYYKGKEDDLIYLTIDEYGRLRKR